MHKNHRIGLLLCALLLVLCAPLNVSANSAEPPGMIVIVMGAPEDVALTIEFPSPTEDETHINHASIAWEHHFRFYYHTDMENLENARIRVTSSDGSFTCPLPDGVDDHYNNLLTLNYAKQTLTADQPVWRQPLYTALRVILTLLIEGLVFFLFGFREKRSWIVFLIVNLLTQLWVNVFVASHAFSGGYWALGYFGIEFLIFLGESIAFPATVREKQKWKCVVYALAANFASLLIGSWLISNLPV